MDLNSVMAFISLVFGLVCIFIGIWVAARLSGKLRKAIVFLDTALFIFVIREILTLYIFLTAINLELIRNAVTILIIFFILLAIINMKQMIDGIDGHYKKGKQH